MWHEGAIGIPKDGNSRIAHYWVKAGKRKSKNGINGGKITQMLIKIGGETILDYNNGWIKEPDEEDQMAMVAYYICLKEYN